MTVSTFTLSVEPVDGATFQHSFHLGTIEKIARETAQGIFHNRNRIGKHTRTVALIRDRKIFDVYDGEWSSRRKLD